MNSLDRLETLLALSEYGSFTIAAKKLYCSQPTISHHIQQLEQHYGAVLVERDGKRIRLTEQGEIVRKYAEAILQMVKESEHAVQQSLLKQRRIMAVYVSNYLSEHYLDDILDNHYRNSPDDLLEIHSYCYGDLRKCLLEGQSNLALMPIYRADVKLLQQFDIIPLFEEPLVLVVPGSHPWSRRKLLYPRDLDKQIVCVPQSDFLCDFIKEQLQLIRSRNPFLQMSNFNLIKKSVISGHGIAFLPFATVRSELEANELTAVKVAGFGLHRQNGILIRKGVKLDNREQRFVEQIRDYFKPIALQNSFGIRLG